MSSKEMKWGIAQIIEFLELYENYPVLWNSSLKEYKDRNLRYAAFQDLADQLRSSFPNITVDLVRSKIKSIKTIVRQECVKITKSKKSGAGSDEIYEPKLSWFNAARFLIGSSSSRRTTSTLDKELPNPPTEDNIIHEPGIGDVEDVDPPSTSNHQPQQQPKKSKREAPGMKPPRPKKIKRSELQVVENVLQQLHEISQTVTPVANSGGVKQADDELSLFGQYVTAQLRLLNPINSLNAQNAIQKILVEERIESLKQKYN